MWNNYKTDLVLKSGRRSGLFSSLTSDISQYVLEGSDVSDQYLKIYLFIFSIRQHPNIFCVLL